MALLLILRLESVIQSWGTRSRWDYRDSGMLPSKSGVVGMLACALGWARSDGRLARLQGELTMGVRADKQGLLLNDYQTVTRMEGNLYNAKGVKRTMPGKSSNEPDTILTPRQYLCDAAFTVVLDGPAQTLKACADALENPVWQLYLGRKACVPTRPVFDCLTDEYSDLRDALERHPLREGGHTPCPVELETPEGRLVRQDVLVESGVSYDYRRLETYMVKGG